MIKKTFMATLIGILVLPFIATSQESNLGNWLIYIGNKKLNNTWNMHHEVQYRNYDAVGDLEQLLLRTGLGYTFNESKNNILLGYGYILSENYIGDNDEKATVNEHRIFQQFTSKQDIGKLKLNHRYRFEQRFVEADFKMRVRYFLGFNYPLSNKKEGKNSLYLSAYNEVFLNTESDVFDRNRVYGGLGYRFSENLKLELGYMNQFFENSGRDQINIIAFVNF
jgi:long-subunit fatty acid transport protein